MLYYSTEIFAAAGVKHGDIATVVVVGLTLVTFTLITVRKTAFLLNFSSLCNLLVPFFQVFLIEKLGRRTLMLYGIGGMAMFFTFLTSMFCFEVSTLTKFKPLFTHKLKYHTIFVYRRVSIATQIPGHL